MSEPDQYPPGCRQATNEFISDGCGWKEDSDDYTATGCGEASVFEYWSDELVLEDDYAELPKNVLDAIDALNAEIKKLPALVWQPGKFQ